MGSDKVWEGFRNLERAVQVNESGLRKPKASLPEAARWLAILMALSLGAGFIQHTPGDDHGMATGDQLKDKNTETSQVVDMLEWNTLQNVSFIVNRRPPYKMVHHGLPH